MVVHDRTAHKIRPAPGSVRPVVIANSARADFQSKLNRRWYSISVAMPMVKAPEGGCPVLYVLDGEWYFGSAVEAVRNNAPGVAVVGIGYPDGVDYVESVLRQHQPLPEWAREDAPFRAAVGLQRMHDLSLPASDEVIGRDLPDGSGLSARDVGGLDSFLEVLETEVKDRVLDMVPIDRSHQAIFGHSLAGMAVLHSLFLNPNGFRTFVAASPSIWWSERAVLGGELKFADAVRRGVAAPRVLITMGSEEQTADANIAAKAALEFSDYSLRIGRNRMVDNARELVERLRCLRGSGDFHVEEYVVFPKQGHNISAWPALGRAIEFAFPV